MDQMGVTWTREEKYEAIKTMKSIAQATSGEYPTQTSFFKALAENRVSGDFTERIVLVHSDSAQSYTFVKARKVKCHRCGHDWFYTGKSEWYVSCPSCKTSVRIRP